MSQTTKRALEASLKNLLLKKPLDKITIQDIADDCGISRMTFYYHFKDIYDLVEWSCMEDATRALAGMKTYSTWQQGFLQIFQMALANKKLDPQLETIFLNTNSKYMYLSSSLVKQIAAFGGDIDDFVPQAIIEPIKQRLSKGVSK